MGVCPIPKYCHHECSFFGPFSVYVHSTSERLSCVPSDAGIGEVTLTRFRLYLLFTISTVTVSTSIATVITRMKEGIKAISRSRHVDVSPESCFVPRKRKDNN